MSDEKTYHDPHVALNRIYTRRGDAGETALAGGQRISKHSPRIECYGTVDELNAVIGMACVSSGLEPRLDDLTSMLFRIQHELFNLGSLLATLPQDVHPRQPRITGDEVAQLEREIDLMNESLPPLRSFVLPGGCRLNAELHLARTVCRRAERLTVALAAHEAVPEEAVRYLNRLSDALFVYSRWVNHRTGVPEVLWEPNRAASASKQKGEPTE